MSSRGALYLIPTPIGGDETGACELLPARALQRLRELDCFIVENAKSARHFLRSAGHPRSVREIEFLTLDEHTRDAAVVALLAPLLAGRDTGLLSEAGCPAVADPGALLVRLAHEHGISVIPLVGPSAVLLALMASGLNGQRFAFHGYLPVHREERRTRLRSLEDDSARADRTQILIEAPYRNNAMLQAIIEFCNPDTLLCVATDLTLPSESLRTRRIAEWKKNPPELNRRPTVFLIYRQAR